jgi:N-acyl amino acid synthase of PEP-CTERM/exosortase system
MSNARIEQMCASRRKLEPACGCCIANFGPFSHLRQLVFLASSKSNREGIGMVTPQLELTGFAPYFRSCMVCPDIEEDLMRRIFELRFQVYCQECGFLPPSDYVDGLESDAYDAGAVHFCAFDARDELVGYVRLVRPAASEKFPFQLHCPTLLDGVTLPDPSQCVEVSRLMVRQDYRRRRGDILAGANIDSASLDQEHEKRNKSPQILLSLYRQIYTFSRSAGVRYWYAAMEPSLALVLTRMNFGFRQIGPLIDYYGPVAPYLAAIHDTELGLGAANPALLAWMRESDTM